MPDIRYALRNGDRTTTDGFLISTGESMFHHGVKVGVEGDHATCPVCKVGGPVRNDCYPAFDVHGKQILVSGARVYCKCPTPPLVIHSQNNFTIEVSRAWHGSGHASPAPAAASNEKEKCATLFDEQIQFMGPQGIPLAYVKYQIDLEDGSQFSGVTDRDGYTERIETEARARITHAIINLDGEVGAE